MKEESGYIHSVHNVSNLIAAHLLLASDDDIMRLAENDVRVVNCPGSNAKAAKGVARIPEMAEAGCIATLGTDGPSSGNTLWICLCR